jgi:hypothetical protein
MSKDIAVLRKLMDGHPITLEQCEIWEEFKNRVTSEKESRFVGYQAEHIQDGKKVSTIAKDLLKRHLITPIVDDDKQTFVITETGRMVATYEQMAFTVELPTIAEYA